jgi:hypothetical protein
MVVSTLRVPFESFCSLVSSKKPLLLEALGPCVQSVAVSFAVVVPFQFLNFLAIAFPIFFWCFHSFSLSIKIC